MFKIESYVTPILLSYVDKYVRDFKPADAQVSLWGGGVALHNLVLKADVLQKEVALPFTLVSGRIHELLIQVPWTKIMSEPIVVTIDTIECVLSLNPPTESPAGSETILPPEPPRRSQVVEAPPGYMQALVRRIVSNIALRVHHLIVKYVQDDIVMSLNVKHLAVDSAGVNWEPAFADIDQNQPTIRRLVRLDDLTLCLDKSDADGKIRFYQEPLLYRCQLDLRVLTRLMSANTRRATSLNIQLYSARLAFSVTNDQLILLLRLIRERPMAKPMSPPPKQNISQVPQSACSVNSAEPARSESWSEWAWSWLPTWMDREGGVQDAPVQPTPLPVLFTTYLDEVSLVFKVMESDIHGRKRARGILEFCALQAAIKCAITHPTSLKVRFGTRELLLQSFGKCVCGYMNHYSYHDEPTVYLNKIVDPEAPVEPWKWPTDAFADKQETPDVTPDVIAIATEGQEGDLTPAPVQIKPPEPSAEEPTEYRDDTDDLFSKMAPIVYIEFTHDRSPPQENVNPYENPPKDFEYSDWVEECNMTIKVEPMELRVCMGLIHRIIALYNVYKEHPLPTAPKPPMRTLTVEECDALVDNLPQRRIIMEACGIRVVIIPWDHVPSDKPVRPNVTFDLDFPKTSVIINGPLYPHRISAAVCQMPDELSPLWHGARLHVSLNISGFKASISDPETKAQRPCARADVRLVVHILLNKDYFQKRDVVEYSYHLKVKEISLCGSSARLQTAYQVPLSLYNANISIPLKHTTLAKDALHDEDAVAIDFTIEDFGLRGYITNNINTHIITMQTAKGTALHNPQNGETKQVWLFSAPDSPSTSPYLRGAIQWCTNPVPNSFDYLGVWTEPLGISIDPLLIAWLAYKPILRPCMDQLSSPSLRSSSSLTYMRRRTPPSSSGRGVSRTGSGADMVHGRSRSHGSSSEPSEKKDYKMTPAQQKPAEPWWTGERLVALHARMRSMLLNVETGLVLVYVTFSSASAVDCVTLRDAMERHAAQSHRVLAVNLGRLSVHSSAATKHMWQCLRHDGPTIVENKPDIESFPWKIVVSDVSCYTLEIDKGHSTSGGAYNRPYKSTLKTGDRVSPRTLLELVTTSITVSVVTKSIKYKKISRKEFPKPGTSAHDQQQQETKAKYFSTGMEFKPTSLKEFVRGPPGRSKRASKDKNQKEKEKETTSSNDPELCYDKFAEEVTITDGPVVSLGVHLHADTPPVIIRLEQEQVSVVISALHGLNHILTLLKRPPITLGKPGYTSLGGSHRSLVRSVSELDEMPTASEGNESDQSELMTLFDRNTENDRPLKTFFWFQWVISHANLVVSSCNVKIAFDIDDLISTVDLQEQYNQLKIKVASATVKRYERYGNNDWTAGPLGGRVLEAREPTNANEQSHFLAVTITQAQISNLPASWKEELHPKLLEQKNNEDSMWEIYATLAPLEAVLQPSIIDNLLTLVREMSPRSYCPLKSEVDTRTTNWQWPFCYIMAGGIRVLIAGEEGNRKIKEGDDTFMFTIGKINVNPHPENPICRRAVNTMPDSGWMSSSGSFEGRQYEIMVKNVSITSTEFKQILNAEQFEDIKGVTSENPALRWSQRIKSPNVTPILYSLDICCVLAPALYMGGVLASGPAIEFNLVSDCSIELNVAQLVLLSHMANEFKEAANSLEDVTATPSSTALETQQYMCPYLPILQKYVSDFRLSDTDSIEQIETVTTSAVRLTEIKSQQEAGRSVAGDSGVETIVSSSKSKTDDGHPLKKVVSVMFAENVAEASDFFELFITMGVIDVILYVAGDDDSPELEVLRTPRMREPELEREDSMVVQTTLTKEERKEEKLLKRDRDKESMTGLGSSSLTDQVRETDIGQTLLETPTNSQQLRKFEENVPLLQFTLQQPNLYYWRRKTQKTLQVSLFNAWITLGVGPIPGLWHAVLLSTAKGAPDPVTDIPPALATLKVVAPVATAVPNTCGPGARGTITLDIEKPVQIEVSTDRLLRLMAIQTLLHRNLKHTFAATQRQPVQQQKYKPALYKLRNRFLRDGFESVTVHTSQISVLGSEGVIGWDSASFQFAATSRPDRLNAKVLVTALLVSAGPPADRRHVVLQPFTFGIEMEAIWEAWRKVEGGVSARDPSVTIGIELDRITLDIRPIELDTVVRIRKSIMLLIDKCKVYRQELEEESEMEMTEEPSATLPPFYYGGRLSRGSIHEVDSNDHYYKDDLRSGAFKILSGGQLPMAYQVMLHGNAVSWRYPHPRAVTRIVAFPLPDQDKEIDCVLEIYSPMLDRWEPHTYFKIPVGEPSEIHVSVPPPEAVFANTWRFRVCTDPEPTPPPYEFSIKKFQPKIDPAVVIENQPETSKSKKGKVTAEQLSGVLRVDSYFAPAVLPRVKIILRSACFQIHVHNSLPEIYTHSTYLEGYYVSKPLMRSHRVLSLSVANTTAHAHVASPAGALFVLDTQLSGDILDCTTGTIEALLDKLRLQSAVSFNKMLPLGPRTRVITSGVNVALHVPRLRTLHALAKDWQKAFEDCTQTEEAKSLRTGSEYSDLRSLKSRHEIAEAIATVLEGRVALWIHNSSASSLRVGQEGTDEVVPLGPEARLAYRWRSPSAPKRLRFSLTGPTQDWHWSSSIPFVTGTSRLRLEEVQTIGGKDQPAAGVFVHVRVEEIGARRTMHLSGRLVLANMLRFNILYKVRARVADGTNWRTVSSGELGSESLGRSVACGGDGDMVLKVKVSCQSASCQAASGWSGDIPLKECPKENVPWLVKVPSEGELQYISVWCRVVRGRSDGRILATLWPLYVLHSHLPLDTDVLIVTEASTNTEESPPPESCTAPMIQSVPGRGATTHLRVPGTTSARHNLSFQYRNIECPVTREAVPLHYGVTDVSVFDKRTPVSNIEDVITEIRRWQKRTARNVETGWPYSMVTKHWGGVWQPAVLQPRCDVTVRYSAVRAGGGCSLDIELCPVVLLCNSTPIALTLRAHDAAPLCKLESGSAISPPSPILTKPFFMSIELGRETFVSNQLQVSSEEPGRYGTPPPGHVVLDHATEFSITCNQKVALLTLFYEIKENINILGITSSFVLINRLKTNLLVSAVVVPHDYDTESSLRPKTFKLVAPTRDGSMSGTPLSRFWLIGRWRGGVTSELRAYLCLSLPGSMYSTRLPVPVKLGDPPVRRALALVNSNGRSIPIVVTQIKHEHRWLIVVSEDPCPQFMVQNQTALHLAVAQAVHFADKPSTSHTEPIQECAGVRWWCSINPQSAVHYSTPSHSARYPPTAPPTSQHPGTNMPFLTFAKGKDVEDYEWCAPVAITEGEQLLQFSLGVTIKLRVTIHPHSTLLELQEVDQNDISASDIRKRLYGAFESLDSVPETVSYTDTVKRQSRASLERVEANPRLLHPVGPDEHLDPSKQSSGVVPTPSSSGLSERRSLKSIENFVYVAKYKDSVCSTMAMHERTASQSSLGVQHSDLSEMDASWVECEKLRWVFSGVSVKMSASADVRPLIALHLDRTAILMLTDLKKTKTVFSIADAQIDNLQYESGQYDFPVVVTTRSEALEVDKWPPIWTMFSERGIFSTRQDNARILVKLQQDKWEVIKYKYKEITELELQIGTLALYVEDAYVKALVDLFRLAVPPSSQSDSVALSEEQSLCSPLRLRLLHVHPLDLTLTLHTAVRMYIALDQSPLRLSAFKLHDIMTSAERLTHALTVHYLSAAILGAGWVVGGLELLGAPGALAARLGGATGGVRGVASAAAAALLRSLIAWSGSLARNLDLLAGDEEHARRAAAARRRPPHSFVAGLAAGITNFAINILGAVGGLAHHPLVGVAVGETESGATALRRGILGALTKPLSATADLVAYAGTGLLRQTGWDPVPEPRRGSMVGITHLDAGWQRDCVRWMFRLCEYNALAGFEVMLDNANLQLLLTHKLLVVADPETERIVEMIELKFCSLGPYQGEIIELCVTQQKKQSRHDTRNVDEDNEFQITAAAMARVARYTGAEGTASNSETRVLSLLPRPGRSHSLHAALAAALHHNSDTHFSLL